MKLLILAGGFGTRISEESGVRPKPMVEIGDKPILWHIMKIYSSFGINDFVILCGYKGHIIKEYFANYFLHASSVRFDLAENKMEVVNSVSEPWKVTLLDTGLNTLTGGRIKQAQPLVGNSRFLLTYGDGVANVNIKETIAFHERSQKHLTMTAIQPAGRFGSLKFDSEGNVESFQEKPTGESGWINGGFFVCEPDVFNYITEDEKTIFERAPLEKLASEKQIACYKHSGFWKCMDTLADKNELERMWKAGQAEWKVW